MTAALAGCAAYQDLITLDIRTVAPGEIITSNGHTRELNVAVAPLQDRRSHPGLIGRYTRFWGKQVPLVVEGADLGEVLALDAIDYLKSLKGWQAWIGKRDIVLPARGVDLTISAHVLEWTMDAKDWGVLTRIHTTTQLGFSDDQCERRP